MSYTRPVDAVTYRKKLEEEISYAKERPELYENPDAFIDGLEVAIAELGDMITEECVCPYRDKCQNGDEGCYARAPETCVRFMPLEGTNFTNINGVVETPPDIDYDKFSQYFTNWIESMGWTFCGSLKKYEEE